MAPAPAPQRYIAPSAERAPSRGPTPWQIGAHGCPRLLDTCGPFVSVTRELLRTRPSPLTWDQACTIRGASPAGPPPRPSTEPVTAQRRASNTGIIMIAGQKIALGRIHARRVVTVHVAADTIAINLGGDDIRTVRRTTTQPVRTIKAHRPREARTAHVS
jgi:hypothetical protein